MWGQREKEKREKQIWEIRSICREDQKSITFDKCMFINIQESENSWGPMILSYLNLLWNLERRQFCNAFYFLIEKSPWKCQFSICIMSMDRHFFSGTNWGLKRISCPQYYKKNFKNVFFLAGFFLLFQRNWIWSSTISPAEGSRKQPWAITTSIFLHSHTQKVKVRKLPGFSWRIILCPSLSMKS